MKDGTPEKIIRDVIRLCTNCDTCRYLMEEGCVFFPNCTGFGTAKLKMAFPLPTRNCATLRNFALAVESAPARKFRPTSWRQKAGIEIRRDSHSRRERLTMCRVLPGFVAHFRDWSAHCKQAAQPGHC